ncbi:MAG: hypothetical protein II863_05425 [Kiritimatiellae bacterium]|nr:hypothetical protein [Kiritimatiellia bacterium]
MKKLVVITAVGMCLCGSADSQRVVCGGNTCRIEPAGNATDDAGYAVVSPVGNASIKPIEQAPRLDTLAGKTIAVVGHNFMARVTHPEIKRLILEKYPTAKVILQDEICSAGMYPAPGLVRPDKDRFQRKLKEMKVDAVISGNGGCGLCTPKETGSCIAAEYVGIPSVIIAGPGFVDQAKCTALNNGVAVLRCAEYPGAFALHTEAELLRNTREVLWPQIVDALTKPITDAERAAGAKGEKSDIRDDVFHGTFDEIQAFFKEMNWSDGLPVVPPTFAKVEGFMKFSPCKWDETVVVPPPANREVKAWHVAVNAVMAGCKPEYMPILVAMAKGMGVNKFYRTLSSTHGWMPFCWLNGPVARQLGVDCGQGQINEEANMAIGRFMNLAMTNLCGYYIKQDRMGTFGYPMPWCLAEDEEACLRVGWKPHHVRAGFGMDESAITLASALAWGNNMTPSTTNPQKIAELMAWDITERCQFALGSGNQFANRTIMMTEPVAAILAKKYGSVEKLESDLVELARRPVRERTFAKYYAAPGSAKDGGEHTIREYSGYIRRTEGAEMTPTAPWRDFPDAEQLTIPVMKAGMTDFLITGDAARNKIQTLPGAGLGGGSATVKIELPANWDELMSALGYKPLADFKLHGEVGKGALRKVPQGDESRGRAKDRTRQIR